MNSSIFSRARFSHLCLYLDFNIHNNKCKSSAEEDYRATETFVCVCERVDVYLSEGSYRGGWRELGELADGHLQDSLALVA